MTAILEPLTRQASRTADAAGRQDANAREKRVSEMLPLVRQVAVSIARRLPSHIELDELVAYGHLGLLDALCKFDPSRRTPLKTYACIRIRGAILDGLRQMDWAPRDLRSRSKRVEKAYSNLQSRLGRDVNQGELAQKLGMRIKEWHLTRWRLEAIRVSLWQPSDALILDASALETLIDSSPDPFEKCYLSEIRQILRRACATLPRRQQFILAKYYDESVTLREISGVLGVDASRVSQLHSQALERLRRRVCEALHWKHAGPKGIGRTNYVERKAVCRSLAASGALAAMGRRGAVSRYERGQSPTAEETLQKELPRA